MVNAHRSLTWESFGVILLKAVQQYSVLWSHSTWETIHRLDTSLYNPSWIYTMNTYINHLSMYLSSKNNHQRFLKSPCYDLWLWRKNCLKLLLTLSIFSTWSLPSPDSGAPAPLHDCSAGGGVDKPKSGLAAQTNYAVVVWRKKKKAGSKTACWDANWPSGCNLTEKQWWDKTVIYLFAACQFIHDISRRYSVTMMAAVHQQPGVWWSNDTHFVWCGRSNC